MKIRNIDQASIFILSGAKVLNCGKYKGKYGQTVWIEFKEDDNFKVLMDKWNNREFIK